MNALQIFLNIVTIIVLIFFAGWLITKSLDCSAFNPGTACTANMQGEYGLEQL